MNIALIVLSRPLFSPLPFILLFRIPHHQLSGLYYPPSSYQHQLRVTNPPTPPTPSPQKLEEVTNLQERVEAIGEGVSISQHHGVENRDMGMREGFRDSRGLWDGDSGWRGGRWG